MESTPRVLAVDDEKENLDLIERALSAQFQVSTFIDPRKAIAALDDGTYAVILCDQRMPEMSGVDFFRSASQKSPDSFRLLVTGSTDLGMVTAALKDRVVHGVLYKPVDADALLAEVNRYHGIYRSMKTRAKRASVEAAAEGPAPTRRTETVLVLGVGQATLGPKADWTAVGLEPVNAQVADAASAVKRDPAPAVILVGTEGGAPPSEVCQHLRMRGLSSGIPLIVAASPADDASVQGAWRCADDFAQLPLDLEALRQKLVWPVDPDPRASPRTTELQQILLVEESRFYRLFFESLLRDGGYTVMCAATTAEAVALAKKHRDTLRAALVDVSGAEGTLKALHEASRAETPLLAMTANDLPADKRIACETLTGYPVLDKRTAANEQVLAHVARALQGADSGVRRYARVQFSSLLEFRAPGGRWATALSYDIGQGGLFVKTIAAAPFDSRIELNVPIESIGVCRGRVAWINPFQKRNVVTYPAGFGVSFDALSTPQSEAVRRAAAKFATKD